MHRVTLRHTSEQGVFQIMFMGPEADLDDIQNWNDVQTVQGLFNKLTGRSDLNIIEIIWQGEWRYVSPSLSARSIRAHQ